MSSALVDNKNRILLSMSVAEESIDFTSSIETAIEHTELELYSLEETINSLFQNLNYIFKKSIIPQ